MHYSDLLWGWVVTRFDDVGQLLRDPTISSDIHNATPSPLTENELARLAEQTRASRTVVLMDDPDHTRIRKLMAKPFRPPRDRRAARQHHRTSATGRSTTSASTRGDGRIEIDLVGDFAYPLPVEVFSEMLGVPDEDQPRFRYWTQCVARSIDPIITPEERDECLAGLDEMYAYLEELRRREARRRPPTTCSPTWCTSRSTASGSPRKT